MAPTENTYAEKWTLERTLQKLQEIESYALSEECYYLGQALLQAGLYNDIWAYWRRKWKHEHDVTHIMKGILQQFEVRLFTGMIRGKVNTRVGTFALKHHYGWDRAEEAAKPTQSDPFSLEPEDDFIDDLHDDLSFDSLDGLTAEEKAMFAASDVESQPAEAFIPGSLKADHAFAQPFSHKRTGVTPVQLYTLHKHRAYNALHPDAPLQFPIAYFEGTPPAGLPAIPFEGGYFMQG